MKKKLRINKYLSRCGLGSRRSVEELVLKGRVSVNGSAVRDLAFSVDPDEDTVLCGGVPVTPRDEPVYLILNKPKGYITTLRDERGRSTVMDLIPPKYRRAGVVPVGRLDRDTEGLFLLTNDGDLAYHLTHPRFGINKEYTVIIDRPLAEEDRLKIEKGIYMHGMRTAPAKVEFLNAESTRIKLTITEGKKRQIRLTFMHLGYSVAHLKRTALGPLKLFRIDSGSFRQLKPKELNILKKTLQL